MTTVSNAVAQRNEQPSGSAVIERYRNVFAEVLPTHIKPETWVRVAQGALRRDERLAAAAARNPESLVSSLLDAARLGLEPGTEQYYLVAYGNEVQGIPGYQGEVELIYRAGAVSSVIVEVVYANDAFSYQPGLHDRPIHEIDWDAEDRGKLRLVYAYAVMKDGATSRVVVMNRAEVMKHKAMSRGSDRSDSPWNKWEQSMWLKTAAHELAKWVPTSAEYLRDQARAAGEMIRHATRPTSGAPVGPQPPQQAERRDEPVKVDVIDSTATEVSTDEQPPARGAKPAGRPATEKQQADIIGLVARVPGLEDEAAVLRYVSEQVHREVASLEDLTNREAAVVIAAMERAAAQAEPPAGGES